MPVYSSLRPNEDTDTYNHVDTFGPQGSLDYPTIDQMLGQLSQIHGKDFSEWINDPDLGPYFSNWDLAELESRPSSQHLSTAPPLHPTIFTEVNWEPLDNPTLNQVINDLSNEMGSNHRA
jgi:hypothetical protein